jgi:hypothetical protein
MSYSAASWYRNVGVDDEYPSALNPVSFDDESDNFPVLLPNPFHIFRDSGITIAWQIHQTLIRIP